jgi:hypothetical protein
MRTTSSGAPPRGAAAAGQIARRGAGLALAILVFAAALFSSAWALGGQDAVSDNWVGVTVVVALFVGLIGSFAALVTALFAGVQHERWSRLWLPLTTFPTAIVIVALLETFVFE